MRMNVEELKAKLAWVLREMRLSGKAPMPVVSLAGDARRDISTIEALRAEKDW